MFPGSCSSASSAESCCSSLAFGLKLTATTVTSFCFSFLPATAEVVPISLTATWLGPVDRGAAEVSSPKFHNNKSCSYSGIPCFSIHISTL